MDKSVSIVKVDQRPYRVIAQENWGLTDGQMAGKHVHHRIAKSRGGTNDPSNLYVCGPWFHKNIWHAEDSFNSLILHASEGGRQGGVISPVGKLSYEQKFGIFGLSAVDKKEAEIKGGISTYLQGVGCHDPQYKGVGAIKTNSTLWEDPDHPELGQLPPGPLSMRQKARGLPHGKENRRKVYSPETRV
jgi:hypothetical protein